MKQKRMKTSAKLFLSALAVVILIGLIWIFTKPSESKPETEQQTQAELIEVEGDIEIIIPEDQESSGF